MKKSTTEQSLSAFGTTIALTQTISLLISIATTQTRGQQDDNLTGIQLVAQEALYRALSVMRASDFIEAVWAILASGEPKVCAFLRFPI